MKSVAIYGQDKTLLIKVYQRKKNGKIEYEAITHNSIFFSKIKAISDENTVISFYPSKEVK